MKRILTACCFLLVSCSFDIDVSVGLDLKDPCLTCFPSCTAEGTSCVQQNGDECTGCMVSCLVAAEFECVVDQPVCTQTVASETIEVPVFCLGPQNFE